MGDHGSEGRCKQNPGPRHTKRIGGESIRARGQKDSKLKTHPEDVGVYATDKWDESECANTRGDLFIWRRGQGAWPSLRSGASGEQKSAEDVVSLPEGMVGVKVRT